VTHHIRAGELNATHLGMEVAIDSVAVRARGALKKVWHMSGIGDETKYPRKSLLSIELPDSRGTVETSLATTDQVQLLIESGDNQAV